MWSNINWQTKEYHISNFFAPICVDYFTITFWHRVFYSVFIWFTYLFISFLICCLSSEKFNSSRCTKTAANKSRGAQLVRTQARDLSLLFYCFVLMLFIAKLWKHWLITGGSRTCGVCSHILPCHVVYNSTISQSARFPVPLHRRNHNMNTAASGGLVNRH